MVYMSFIGLNTSSEHLRIVWTMKGWEELFLEHVSTKLYSTRVDMKYTNLNNSAQISSDTK